MWVGETQVENVLEYAGSSVQGSEEGPVEVSVTHSGGREEGVFTTGKSEVTRIKWGI